MSERTLQWIVVRYACHGENVDSYSQLIREDTLGGFALPQTNPKADVSRADMPYA